MRFSISNGRWWPILIFLSGGPAYGQAFNIDCAGTKGTPPSAGYGAAAGQSGYWNTPILSGALKDLNGNLTGVQFAAAGAGSSIHTIPGATGDDARLMETAYEMSPAFDITMSNLIAGQYNVYMYSWGGHVFGPRTVEMGVYNGITIATGSVSFGTVWPGGQVEGVTFARISAEVLPGQGYLSLSIGSGHDYDLLSGIQLVPVPSPGAPLVLLGASLFTSRRARRKEA